MLELRKAVTYMPALALVKAGILMPSHSLRLCWCNSDRGHKGSARSRVQLRPKAAANPEHLADFSRKRGGFLGGKLPEHGQKNNDCRADFTCLPGGNLRRNFHDDGRN